ncbi:hypothetical protein AGMMS49975_08470 [Clostridia bacterium]|nr:hypothetical protein AGMMS49975_08470 [Clostridia bacterium]
MTLIAARLLIVTAPVHIFEALTTVLECGGHQFTAKGKTVLQDGWKAIESAYIASLKHKADKNNDIADDDEDGETLPKLTEGQICGLWKRRVRKAFPTEPNQQGWELPLLARG